MITDDLAEIADELEIITDRSIYRGPTKMPSSFSTAGRDGEFDGYEHEIFDSEADAQAFLKSLLEPELPLPLDRESSNEVRRLPSQHRNDFCAIMVCEWCEHTQNLRPDYDDDYYHKPVISRTRIKTCGKIAAGVREPRTAAAASINYWKQHMMNSPQFNGAFWICDRVRPPGRFGGRGANRSHMNAAKKCSTKNC